MAANDQPPTVARYDSPLYLVICRDRPGSGAARAQNLDGHLRHVEINWQRYVLAGPLRQPGAQPLIGSYFLVRAADEADARALMAGDPYVSSGMYATMEVLELYGMLNENNPPKTESEISSLTDIATKLAPKHFIDGLLFFGLRHTAVHDQLRNEVHAAAQ